jgi:hypothetical protein
MYISTWAKYLPVLKILLKRSEACEQIFNLNVSDFKLAGATRKTGYKFIIQFLGGRVNNVLTCDIARDFAFALLEDVHTKEIIIQNNYDISMNEKFQLCIKFVDKTFIVQDAANEKLVYSEVIEP